MTASRRKLKKRYTLEELYNPQIDVKRDACLYGGQSTKDQVINNVQSHISQTLLLLEYAKELGFTDDGKTGKVTLFVENQVVDADGNVTIKNASGTWPIDRRPGLQTIYDLIESGKVGVVVAEFVDRLFRDEDRIDNNIFIKVCKENGCFVHISSKRMTYNFANDQHAEMFRLEVQMAAMYIKNHVKGTMLRRRDMVVKLGQWGGIGAIPVGYIICDAEGCPLHGKFTIYEPHAKVVRWIFIRFIELGYDFGALCREVGEMPYVFPPFEPGVPIVRFMMTPVSGGYLISEDCLRYILTNEVYVGNFRRQVQDGEVYREKNHPAIVPEDVFWSAYDHLKDVRPDGTPTGRRKLVRYSQRKTVEEERKPLLKPVSEDGGVYWEHPYLNKYAYKIVRRERLGLGAEFVALLDADILESAVVKRLFEKLRSLDVLSLQKHKDERKGELAGKVRRLEREIGTIDEDLVTLTANMSKIKTEAVVEEIERQMARTLARKEKALADKEKLVRAAEDDALGTLEEELKDIEGMWPCKRLQERKALLELLIETLTVKLLSPRLYRVEIEWNYENWGADKAIIVRDSAGSKDWTEEEFALIADLYPRAPQLEVLKAMPNRTWGSIQQKAHLNGVKRVVKLKEEVDVNLTWRDIQFLHESGLTLGDFREYRYSYTVVKQRGWCCQMHFCRKR